MREEIKNFDPAKAFAGMEDVLPVCPCGCGGKRASMHNIKGPSYLIPQLEKHFKREKDSDRAPNYNDLAEVEARIIREKDWQEEPLVHVMRHIKVMAPWVTHDPYLVRSFRESLACEKDGIRQISTMGHASSGKTEFMIIEAFHFIHVYKTVQIFCASPFLKSAKYSLWQRFRSFTQELRKSSCIDSVKKSQDTADYISLRPNTKGTRSYHDAGPGTIRLICFHTEGVIQGTKQKNHDSNAPALIICSDEVSQYKNKALLIALGNLRSQSGLRVRTSCNFQNAENLEGDFHAPAKGTFRALKREEDMRWRTARGGLSLRFRAKWAPNIYSGVDYYSYLIKNSEYKEYVELGVNSAEFLSMADAWFSASSLSNTLLWQKDIDGGRALEQEVLSRPEIFAFMDPAFTYNGDGAVINKLSYGYSQGDQKYKISCDDVHKVEIPPEMLWTPELVELAKFFRHGKELKPNIIVGNEITGEQICALRLGEYARDNNIPLNNVGYDESMRGDLVHEMNYFLGEGPQPYRYGGKPDNRQAFPTQYHWKVVNGQKMKTPKNNDECHKKMVSQMWVTTVNLIKNGYICNGETVTKAFDEMKKRSKDPESTKKNMEDVETKDDYKKRNKNVSPDYADTFCGGCNMIVERRFRPQVDASDRSHTGDIAVLEAIFADDGPRRGNMLPNLSR